MKRKMRLLLITLTLMLLAIPTAVFADNDWGSGAYPTAISFSAPKGILYYKDNKEVRYDSINNTNNKLTLTMSNGTKQTFKYVKKKEGWYLNGKTSSREVWFDYEINKDGKCEITMLVFYETKEDYYDKKLKTTVAAKVVPTPVSATFSGKITHKPYLGEKELRDWLLYKKGNKITVKYTNGSKKVFKYIEFKNKYGLRTGFFLNGNKKGAELSGDAFVKKGIKKGTNKVTFNLEIFYPNEYARSDLVNMKNVSVKADSKVYSYVAEKYYVYTGKVIKPTIVVKDGVTGKTISPKKYTVKYIDYNTGKMSKKPLEKKYGIHSVMIEYKKGATNRYGWGTSGHYEIGPKATKLNTKKTKGGKNKITAAWKKVSGIDGYVIEISKSSTFRRWNSYDASKKKTSLTIRDQEKGTYYVKVRTYKKIKGERYFSAPSKKKKIVVK